ncbi:HD domain-containing phosphohydrolase [Marinobacter sp. M1N3S26]|uniref:HD domain-containing phosphohydrolase n=1 Tax=Marinobacter sp. M1N3S26 TaxID=3382299 RepID=UPI00387AB39D
MGHPRKQFSLGFLTAAVISLSLVLLASILIATGYRSMSGALVTAATDYTHQLSTTLNARVKAILGKPETDLQWLRYHPVTGADSLDERLRHLPVLLDWLQDSELVSAVYLGYADGDFLLLRDLAGAPEQDPLAGPPGSRYLLQSVERGEDGDSVTGRWRFYDDNLALLSERAMPDYRFDPRNRPWFSRARDTTDTVVTAPYVFFTTREIGVTMARRSPGTGTILGLDATLTDLGGQLHGLRLTPGTELAIVNKQQQLLAHPDRDRMRLTGDGATLQLRTLMPGRPGNRPAEDALATAAGLPQGGEVKSLEYDGDRWFGVNLPLTGLPTEALNLVVAIPEDELLADARTTLVNQTLVSIGILALFVVVGWLLGHRIATPFHRLTDHIRSLARFDFQRQPPSDSRVREAAQLGRTLSGMSNAIRGFETLSLTLNRERQLDRMLSGVLDQLLRILGERSGGIYLFEPDDNQLTLARSANSPGLPAFFANIRNRQSDAEIIATLRTTLPGNTVVSVLRDRNQHLTGVLVIELEDGADRPADELVDFITRISGAAAVAIETRQLIESQQALLDGIIRLVADAIDAKSPYTSGHCERVPILARMILDKAMASREGPFRRFTLSEPELQEFHIAAWLHDCGKITTPEYVVDKATKLETLYNRIHEIRTRFEVLHRDAELDYLEALLRGDDKTQARQQRDRRQQQLQQDFALVARCNQGGEFLAPETLAELDRISRETWQRHFSDRLGLSHDEALRLRAVPEPSLPVTEPLLADRPEHRIPWGERKPPVQRDDPDNRWGFDMTLPTHSFNLGELHNLSVARGTLTDEERFHINNHIVQTVRLLSGLPLPAGLKQVPRLAGTHHERMDGEGYPFRLHGEDMSVPEKIMAIADVFEALTAADRPYKDGKPLSMTLAIMADMVAGGHLDGDTFGFFVRSGVWQDYARHHLDSSQVDPIDEDALLTRAGLYA